MDGRSLQVRLWTTAAGRFAMLESSRLATIRFALEGVVGRAFRAYKSIQSGALRRQVVDGWWTRAAVCIVKD